MTPTTPGSSIVNTYIVHLWVLQLVHRTKIIRFIHFQCADLINYPYEKLEKCAKSKEGFDLLATFGDMTHNFRPKLKWVPTVVFNNVSIFRTKI